MQSQQEQAQNKNNNNNNNNNNLEILNQIKDFLKQQIQDPECLQEAIKVANTHYWLYENAEKLSKQFFSFEKIKQKLQEFDPTLASQIIGDENYGLIENRGQLVIEFITDKIIEGIDPGLKNIYVEDQKNEDICIPIIEYASNIFPDVNLFMVFPDLDIPQDIQSFVTKIYEKITEQKEEDFINTIIYYFKEAWPFYSKNMLKFIENPNKISEFLKEQLYKGQEGQCYPSQKRNPIALMELEI